MKQNIFTEAIPELKPKDRVSLAGSDIASQFTYPDAPPFELDQQTIYQVMVLDVKSVGTFAWQVLLLLDGVPNTLAVTRRFDHAERLELLSWQGKQSVDVFAENLEPGDVLYGSKGSEIVAVEEVKPLVDSKAPPWTQQRQQEQESTYRLTFKDAGKETAYTQEYKAKARFSYRLHAEPTSQEASPLDYPLLLSQQARVPDDNIKHFMAFLWQWKAK